MERRCGIGRRLAARFGGTGERTGADGVAAFGGAASVELAKQGTPAGPGKPAGSGKLAEPGTLEAPGEDKPASTPPVDTVSGSSYAMLEFKPRKRR